MSLQQAYHAHPGDNIPTAITDTLLTQRYERHVCTQQPPTSPPPVLENHIEVAKQKMQRTSEAADDFLRVLMQQNAEPDKLDNFHAETEQFEEGVQDHIDKLTQSLEKLENKIFFQNTLITCDANKQKGKFVFLPLIYLTFMCQVLVNMEEQVLSLLAHPDFEGIKSLKKSELVQMANQLDLTANNRMVKAQIVKVIVTHFVENGELDEEILEELREESKARQLELEAQKEQKLLEIEAQKQQKLLEVEAQQRELETRRLELEAQNRRCLIELQLEATKKQQAEEQTRQLEIQQQIADINYRLETQRMAAGHGNTRNVSTNSDNNPIRTNKYIELPKCYGPESSVLA
ncbi:flagellar attachment zone protein 1-like [Procambarus clarkii]|uniref:flagellar attachment zone protein 1-like n=1 Tax=Procambarus clarkii TaxID=6728 RepID=UPI00374264DD